MNGIEDHGIDPAWFILSGRRESSRCGRPTTLGHPCSRRAHYPAPACGSHLTEADWEHIRVVCGQTRERYRDLLPPLRPACWSWPVDHQWVRDLVDMGVRNVLSRWHAGRCAMCGGQADVLDHDHETGWTRGYLCQPCNLLEPAAVDTGFRRYRKHPPARMLGLWGRYSSAFYGSDHGWLAGRTTYRPHPVDSDGVIHGLPHRIDRSPVHVVSRALLGRGDG